MMVSRSGARMTETRSDVYGYNDRNELVSAGRDALVASAPEYEYSYDDIGNRLASLDLGDSCVYQANSLNQYTSISNAASTAEAFVPQYDLDGNQTLVKSATGTWTVTYNGENRPISWTCGATNITMQFDRMGRRVEYLETASTEESVISDGITNIVVTVTTNAHYRFVYDGYLCIQRLNALSNNAVDLAFGWDPTEPVATRPLWMQRVSGTYNFFYFHDGNKNVSELVSYQAARGVPAHYEYAPFGDVTAATTNTAFTTFNVAEANPFRFSSEYADDALGLVYYNYRHYEPVMGRWMSRDPLDEIVSINLLAFLANEGWCWSDRLGLMSFLRGVPGPIIFNVGGLLDDSQFGCPRKEGLTISAFADYGLFSKDSVAINAMKLTHPHGKGISFTSKEDLRSQIDSLVSGCDCIKDFYITAHGYSYWHHSRIKNDDMVEMGLGKDVLSEWNEDWPELENISNFFGAMSGKFCSECHITLYSCALGQNPFLEDRLRRKTGCKIKLYKYNVSSLWGNDFFDRFWNGDVDIPPPNRNIPTIGMPGLY